MDKTEKQSQPRRDPLRHLADIASGGAKVAFVNRVFNYIETINSERIFNIFESLINPTNIKILIFLFFVYKITELIIISQCQQVTV